MCLGKMDSEIQGKKYLGKITLMTIFGTECGKSELRLKTASLVSPRSG